MNQSKWTIKGKVIKGEKRGRKIGFPTCNIKIADYITWQAWSLRCKSSFGKFNKSGIANIGYRPTFNGKIYYWKQIYLDLNKIYIINI